MPKRRYDDDDDFDDRPTRRRRQPKTSKAPIIIGAGALLVVVLVVSFFVFRKKHQAEAAKVTVENFEKIKLGLSADEVQAILGRGEPATVQDIQAEAARKTGNEIAGGMEAGWAGLSAAERWQAYRGDDITVYVGFGRGSSGVERVAYSLCIKKEGGGYKVVQGASSFAGNIDLDDEGRRRKKEDAILGDPRFKTGAEAARLLPGDWRDPNGTGYAFRPDGGYDKASLSGGFDDEKGTWGFDERGRLVLTQPGKLNIHNQPIRQTFTARVGDDEMHLVLDLGGGHTQTQGPYYRAGSRAFDEKVIRPLAGGLKDRDASKRRQAAWKFTLLGPAALPAVPDLVAAIDDADETVCADALRTLGKVGAPAAKQAIPALRQKLRDPNYKQTLWICVALAMMGPAAKEALPDLQELLKRPGLPAGVANEARAAIRTLEK